MGPRTGTDPDFSVEADEEVEDDDIRQAMWKLFGESNVRITRHYGKGQDPTATTITVAKRRG